jgi:hypothetical protein
MHMHIGRTIRRFSGGHKWPNGHQPEGTVHRVIHASLVLRGLWRQVDPLLSTEEE